MKKPETKKLSAELLSFFKQRRAAGTKMNQPTLSARAGSLIIRFNLIQNYGYWRHCLEVKNQKDLINKILPSSFGRQREIRQRIVTLMDHCITIASVSRHEYIQTSQQERHAL